MSQLAFDEKMAAQMEVLYRRRDILRRREIVREALGAAPGERIADVGCGPGFYLVELLEQVGPEGAVVGLDASPQMLAAAAKRCQGHENVSFEEADASSLPVDDASFDALLTVQVLEYVLDVDAALAEFLRVLRPGGRLAAWAVDWATVSVHAVDAERTRRVLAAWDAHLADPSLPRTLAPRMRAAGFEDVRMADHAFATAEFTPEAYGGLLVPLISNYVAGKSGVSEEEAKAWAAEMSGLGERGEFYFSCTQFCFTGGGRRLEGCDELPPVSRGETVKPRPFGGSCSATRRLAAPGHRRTACLTSREDAGSAPRGVPTKRPYMGRNVLNPLAAGFAGREPWSRGAAGPPAPPPPPPYDNARPYCRS